ncbi:ORC1-type DNA replication protein [Candidatus Woesearchaeota archaeon]|nr:ORC1-type DNA replication protein [Candidatus Woesearchaeota archaeon]
MFKNKAALQASYTPETIPHRDHQIESIAKILAPALKGEKPSNLFIYGKTGTGKTLSVKYVSQQMEKIAQQRSLSLKMVYLNCKLKKIADTEYRLIAQLAREFGKAIPPTGLPTDEVYNLFCQTLDAKPQQVVIILDEIDQLVKKAGDELLYNLTRMNTDLKQGQLTILGISNNLVFTEQLDPRVKSSLSEEELVFPPYNALQIQNILKQRADEAFCEQVIQPGVIEKCAALAAREHGDARRALELLRVAGEIAERNDRTHVDLTDLDVADEKIEVDRILDVIGTQPKQFQAVLYIVVNLALQKKNPIFTGEVYDLYRELCKKISLIPLTQRRVSDIIAELDMLGIIQARVISKGRYGRTREICLATPSNLHDQMYEILAEGLNVA